MITTPVRAVNTGLGCFAGRGAYAARMGGGGSRRGQPANTRDRLMAAGERLFASKGVDRVRLREINELAGQRNSSALHYHFGSRDGLVLAILRRHEDDVDAEVAQVLDRWDRDGYQPGVREIAAAVVRPLAAKLGSPNGRDFLQIVPYVVPGLSETLRRGRAEPLTPQTRRVLALFEARIAELPAELRRERLVVYMLMLTAVLADRAQQMAQRSRPPLDHDRFVEHVLDMVEGIFTMPAGGGSGAAGSALASHRALAGSVSRLD
jgi:TetR/AcrR family transcriptional regulator, regulator of cefoperazone and chloramphenicol sensitivity